VREADAVLFERYRHSRAPADRNALVERYLPLARRLAMRYAAPASREDIFQVACLGLVEAVDRYDPDRRCAFSTFAVPTIVGEIKHYLRDKAWLIRVPRSQHELGLKLEVAADRLARRLGAEPSVGRLAEEVGASADDVRRAQRAMRACRVASLDSGWEDGEEDSDTLGDRMGTLDSGYGRAEQRVVLRRLLSALPERDRRILWLRYQEDLTQQEIGRRVGISQMQVSRILQQCVARLRDAADQPPVLASAAVASE
jgi:RNA polymerase sigma-B factor